LNNFEKVFGYAALKILKGFVLENDINPSEIDHGSVKNILLVVRHQMGDMLCTLPMMRSIRNFYPDSHIILVTKRSTSFEMVFKDNNSPVNEVKYFESGFENFINLVKELRDIKIDLSIIPSTVSFSATNHLIAYYSKARYRAGVRSKDYELNRIGYTLNIKNDFLWELNKVHQIERNLDIIRQLSITPSEKTISLSLNEENLEFAEKFFRNNFPDKNRIVIGFHPGAGKEQNIWPAEKFSELAVMLLERLNPYFLISEGPSDTKYTSVLETLLKKQNGLEYTKLRSELANNMAILARLNLFVTNDTGIMHLCSGFQTPVIALFGPTSASEWGVIGGNKVSIQSKDENIKNIDTMTVFETCLRLISV
jgi:heptosyltransferase-2